MARMTTARLLDAGDPFPRLELALTGGGQLTLPGGIATPYAAVLVNRGSWCAFCNAQLRAFQSGLARLAQAGIGVFSLSADPLERAAAMVAANGLTFPVAYGVSVEEVAQRLGAYYDPRPDFTAPYLQSAGFVLGPGGVVLTAVYSSGAIGRLVWQDVLGFVEYHRAHSPARGTAA